MNTIPRDGEDLAECIVAEDFNPYHRWLGISPKDLPPNHYRLLGLDLFEDDPEAIRDAVERQMGHVRRYQLGKHLAMSQKILNELALAKACLSNPEKKVAYDVTLRAEIAQKEAASTPPTALGDDEALLAKEQTTSAPPPQQPDILRGIDISDFPSTFPPRPSRKKKQSWQIPAAIALGAALVIGIVAWLLSGGGGQKEVAQEAQKVGSETISATTEPPNPKPAPKLESKPEPSTPELARNASTQDGANGQTRGTVSAESAPPSEPRPSSPTMKREAGTSPAKVQHDAPIAQPLSPPQPQAVDGKLSLFDGTTLNGWHPSDPGGPNCWSAENGELRNIPQPTRNNNLVTDQLFRDFDLQLEFLLEDRANSGVYLRGMYEVQLYDDNAKVVKPKQRSGAIYGQIAPSKEAYLGPAKWNTLNVSLIGQRVTVTMNGKCIIDEAYVSEPTDHQQALHIKEGDPGPIMLQCMPGGAARFRNVSITRVGEHLPAAAVDVPPVKATVVAKVAEAAELPSQNKSLAEQTASSTSRKTVPFVALFNGKNLRGWHLRDPNGPLCWGVNKGELICIARGKKLDLITDKVFQNFELQLEFLMGPNADSGVFLRGLYQVQLVDTHPRDEKMACGAIVTKVAPSEDAYLGSGCWNTLNVKMIGQRVTVTMNGKRIIDDAEVTGPTDNFETLSIKEGDPGPIMLQCWANEFRFRNIRIRPLK
jgi:hypothetical protein